MPIPEGPQSKLVYATDERELPPRTTFVVRSLPLAAHLATLGYEVVNFRPHRWTVPVAARREAEKFEVTYRAIQRGTERKQDYAKMARTDHGTHA